MSLSNNLKIMAKKNEIVHSGKVIEMTPDFTSVEITVSSACASCHAKSLCGMSEEQDKVIMLPTDPYASYNVGDQVQVCTKMSMGLKAAWISYVIPLAVLMALILILTSVGVNEFISAGAAIGGVGLYYFVIWLMRERLNNEFTFYIKNN
jgi:sigma-E factor negative regulatory protein RseC